jgi:S1-C subfamily serine protease
MTEWNPDQRTPPLQPGNEPPLQPEQSTAVMPVVEELHSTPGEPKQSGRWRRRMVRTAPLLVAAVLGGGIAAGVVVAVDDDGGSTTVIQDAEAAPESSLTPIGGEADEPTATTADLEVSDLGDVLTIQEIYERYSPGVVQVRTLTAANELGDAEDFFGQQPRGLGSGFVIDKEGHIVTNFHVVEDAETVQVVFSDDDNPVEAKVLGVDPSTDIAILEVDTDGRALTPVPLGDSESLVPGDTAIAIGNPFGLDRTVTQGIVSALQRSIRAPDGFRIDNVIQTDAPINSGNSGGPLLNDRGEVIGVNSQILTGGGASEGNVGIGFAVPVNTVRNVASQILETGKVEHAYLGVRIQTISQELAENVQLPVDEGVLVAEVTDGSPAADSGLTGGERDVIVDGDNFIVGGDIVTHVDGTPVTESQELVDVVASKRPGTEIVLDVIRDDGTTTTLTIELGRRPPSGG